MRALLTSIVLATALAGASSALAADPPSRPGVDAPELARLGSFPVGVRTLTLIDRENPDGHSFGAAGSAPTAGERHLTVELWYPAEATAGSSPVTYTATLPSEPPAPPARFSIPGLAIRDAKPAGGPYPLVVVSHGYSNTPVAMSWLTENLASKGYVVAAIEHDDPPITDRTGYPEVLLRRPLDIAFVARSLQASLGASGLVAPERVALIGYSMGGYGVLTSGGATLDATGALGRMVPNGAMVPYARGGAKLGAVQVQGVRAIVALAPAGGRDHAWGTEGLLGLTAPLLLIAGDNDLTVDYRSGARAFFDEATRATRYLLTYHNGGHAIGLNSAPESMRSNLWDFSWFEDPVWRKDKIIAINLHVITAFLDRYVKDEASRAAYLEVPVAEAQAGHWPPPGPARFGETSPGTAPITVWKGFHDRFAAGVSLEQRAASAGSN